MKANEITTTEITLPSGDVITQCVVQEKESGLYFCVDASFVEQSVGPVLSPYGHGTALLDDDGEDGAFLMPDIVSGIFGGPWGEHPSYPRQDWQHDVINSATNFGYWQWACAQLTAKEHGSNDAS